MNLDWGAALLAVVAPAVGLGFAYVAHRFVPEVGQGAMASLILLPALGYFIATGLLSEFGGFGVEAKFREARQRPAVEVARASDLTITDEQANDPNFLRDAWMAACRPYFVLRVTDVPKPETREFNRFVLSVAVAVRASLLCGRLLALVVVDDGLRPLGYFEAPFLAEVLRLPLEQYGASEHQPPGLPLPLQLANTELGVILRSPRERAESQDARHVFLDGSATVLASLGKLMKGDANVAVIVDNLRFRGVVSRPLLAESLVTTLAAPREERHVPRAGE